jgi:ribosomal protein L37AE/L43A
MPHCPKCKSTRIRRGYRPTPLLLRIFGIYNLLCDHCNLLFKGFAIPGTVPRHSAKKKKQQVSGTPESER